MGLLSARRRRRLASEDGGIARFGKSWFWAAVTWILFAGTPAWAQLGSALHGLDLQAPTIGNGFGRDLLSDTQQTLDPSRLTDLRLLSLRNLLRANPRTLDVDDHGAPVVRGEVLALSPSAESLRVAAAAGFAVTRRESLAPLDLEEVVLGSPTGLSARQAVRRLRKLDPNGQYDFDHIYSPSGSLGASIVAAPTPGAASSASGVRIGLVDTGVARNDPVFAGAPIEQQAFALGGVQPAAHGTAVASLMVGELGRFHGAAPGARLYAADVYGSGPTGGSADSIARALAWMARGGVPVINVSLVGPANVTLEAAVRAVIARGELIVAPVGNDGPAAPPLYPASYPGVIAVTGVDPRGRIIFEAGRAKHVDFAAPAVDMLAAKPGGGLVAVRGTSFASPIVAGRLAVLIRPPDPGAAARALDQLARAARLGRGVVGEDVRLDPHAAR